MTRLLLLVACLFLTACASNDRLPNNGKIAVVGVGKTFDEAKNDGFRKAVEIVVGSVIVADTQARNNKLIRDDLAKHSAGYVDDFKINGKTVSDNKITLQMEVQVRSSQIAERVLNVSSASGNFDGNRVAAQHQSFMQDRKTGDQLLNTVLRDYPSKAYNVTKGEAVFGLDKDRNAYISIPFELRWNYNYLKALNEALAIVEDGKYGGKQDVLYVTSKNPANWILGRTDAYYFNDSYRYNRIQQRMNGNIIVIATVSDEQGRTLFTACENAFQYGSGVVSPYRIYGNDVARDTVEVQINRDSPRMKDLDKANKIELTFSAGSCYNSTY